MIKKLQHKLNKDANLKELLSGSAITFVIKITGMLIGYGVVLLVSRRYGAEGTGIYSLTISLLNILGVTGGLGINTAMLRYVGQFNNTENGLTNMKKLFSYVFELALPFALTLGVGLFFLAEKIAINVFENSSYTGGLKIVAVSLPFYTLNLINVDFIRGLKMVKVSEYIRSINRQLIILILLLFSFLSYGILDAIYAMLVGIIVSFIISLIFIISFFSRNYSNGKEAAELSKKELIKTSFPMMTTAMATFILTYAGGVFLEIYGSTEEVGVFNVCFKIAQLSSLVVMVFNTISAPKFAELFWAGEMKELQKVIQQSSKIIFWISSIFSAFIIILSDIVLNFFGNEFLVGKWTLIILIFGQIINASTGSVGVLLDMCGKQNILRNIMWITTLIVIISNYLIIPAFGLIGAAIVSTLGTVLVNIIPATYAHYRLGVNTFFNPFYK